MHFKDRAEAVIQWRGRRLVLPRADSRQLVALLVKNGPLFRRHLISALGRALPVAVRRQPRPGQLYLNIGHTGLNDSGLVSWVSQHGLRAIYFIHDLIPIEAPEFCRPGEADRHARRIAHALASATGIIGNSQATLDQIRRFAIDCDLPCPPMMAAWLASDTMPVDAIQATTERHYFVVLGTIEGRKNHLLLLQLWKRLVERMGDAAPRLLLIGHRGWEAQGAFAMLDRCPALKGSVVELDRCTDVELAGLLRGARALLMPSFAEGFGMPVIEALRLGIPVIASDLPVFREIAGDIPLFLSPIDAVGWERAILDFTGPSFERARQVAATRDYRAPDWPGHFAIVERWLASLPA